MTAIEETPRTLLAGLRTGEWLDAQTFPPLTWVVPGILPEGMSVMAGGPKIGKSWAALDIALALATGGRAFGCVGVDGPRPVLLLALEDGHRRLQERCRQLLGSQRIPPRLHYMTTIEAGTVVATVEEWLSEHGDSEPLVILDTLGKVMPPSAPGESAYQRDYRVAGRLKRICDDHPGMAVVVLHHDRKAQSDDFVDAISGTNGIAGAADTVIVVARPRNQDRALVKVTGRDVEERECEVTVTDGRWAMTGGGLESAGAAAQLSRVTTVGGELGERSIAILGFASRHPEGVRAGEVAEKLGMTQDDARRYLDRLAKADRLDKVGRGLYRTRVLSVPSVLSKDYAVVLPFRQDTQDGHDTGSG